MRSFAQEPRHLREFAELNDLNRDANMVTVKLNAAYFPAVEFVSSLATVLVLAIGGTQADRTGTSSVGVLVGFIAALNGFFDPIGQLSQLYTTYQSGMAALDKIFELLDEQPDLVEPPDPVDAPAAAAGRDHVRRRHVRLRRQARAGGHRRRRSRRARPSRSSARPAPGKSTFAKLVARFYDPTAGRILDRRDRPARRALARAARADGHRAAGGLPVQRHDRRQHRVRQPGRRRPTDLEDACRAVGAWDFIDRLPAGLDTQIGERGVQLSAGQRQLVAFARALVADPRILILDEATSNVDLHTETKIEEGLRRLLAGRTAIVIAHRLSTIRQAGRIVVLDHGVIVEQGTHEELLAAEGAYFSLYRDWAQQAAA